MEYGNSLPMSVTEYQTLADLIDAFNYEMGTGIGAEAACTNAIISAGKNVGLTPTMLRIRETQAALKAEAASRYAWNYESNLKAERRLFSLAAQRELRKGENEPVYQGFSRWEMDRAFRRVCSPKNWKDPINSLVQAKDIPVTEAAIVFYTGSVPVFTKLAVQPDFRYADNELYRVDADGYYLTIGA